MNTTNKLTLYGMYQRGLINQVEYKDRLAVKKGYINSSDVATEYRHRIGLNRSMFENKDSPQYLGICVAERVLSKIFDKVQRMPYGNEGFDFVCKNNFKIDVKSSCLGVRNCWVFSIKKNKIADYFLLLSFDNRADLNPKHIWLIGGNEAIINEQGNRLLNEKVSLTIYNSIYSISKYSMYERTDKLEKLIVCCGKIRG